MCFGICWSHDVIDKLFIGHFLDGYNIWADAYSALWSLGSHNHLFSFSPPCLRAHPFYCARLPRSPSPLTLPRASPRAPGSPDCCYRSTWWKAWWRNGAKAPGAPWWVQDSESGHSDRPHFQAPIGDTAAKSVFIGPNNIQLGTRSFARYISTAVLGLWRGLLHYECTEKTESPFV